MEQPGEGAVDGSGALAVAGLEGAVGVPGAAALGRAAVDLNDSHAAFDQPPRQQTLATGVLGVRVIQGIEATRLVRLLRHVHCLGHSVLHPHRQVISVHAGDERRFVLSAAEVLAVELLEEVHAPPLRRGREIGRG